MTKPSHFTSRRLRHLLKNLDGANHTEPDDLDHGYHDEDGHDDGRHGSREPNEDTAPQALIMQAPTQSDIVRLISTEPQYVMGLRIRMLRTLLNTTAANQLPGKGGYSQNRVTAFLGFNNFERYAKKLTLEEIRSDLLPILTALETQHQTERWLPCVLDANLQALAKTVGLNPCETAVLGLAVVLHAESLLEQCTDIIGQISGFYAHHPIADILGLPVADVQAALSQNGRLARSGLLTVDLQSPYVLSSLLDLLTDNFHARMMTPLANVRDLVSDHVKPVKPSALSLADFTYIAKLADLTVNYLKRAMAACHAGANILVHGAPGTGKSQFARVLAQTLGTELLEVSTTTVTGAAIVPMRRIRNYTIAQSFYGASRCILLFDEADEVFSPDGYENSINEAAVPRKSFINHLLDTSQVPTIWIANNIRAFDPAYIRRFDICFEMPIPPLQSRLQMLSVAFNNSPLVSERLLKSIASHDDVSPALIEQAARVTELVTAVTAPVAANDSVVIDEPNGEALVADLINEKLRAQGKRLIDYPANSQRLTLSFAPELVNCNVDLQAIAQTLCAARAGRLCLYGPPGTGKTAFGKWLAQQLGRPHLLVGPSDLLSMYVGETEQKIARAFASAKRDGAVLQFDEVDSFLQDRRHARQHHETTQVNEMLTQLDQFDGIVIASTNLLDNLDEAAMRRFDVVIRFDFLLPEAARTLFHQTCEQLGLDVDAQSITKIERMRGLAAGDFDQVLRRSRLLRPATSIALANTLAEAVALKRTAANAGIGFMKAA